MNKFLVSFLSVWVSAVSLDGYYTSYPDDSTYNYSYGDDSSYGYSYSNENSTSIEPVLGQILQSPTQQYTIVKELGAGAFGKVFEAITNSGENVALKWYMTTDLSGWYFNHLADHNREFRLGQILNHPHIIKSLESFTEEDVEGSNYTVLEFVPGQTLSSYKRNSLELEQVIIATKQFISGIRHAYHQEFLHLDLHGSNIMLNQDLEVKIIDLSSFFSFEEIEDHNQTKTTTSYQYPEAFKKIEQFIGRHPGLKAYSSYNSRTRTPISKYIMHNFDDVTEVCIRIMLRAKLSKEEKLNIQSELKKISWNCEADQEEGKAIYLDQYLDLLEHYINTVQCGLSTLEGNGTHL